VDTTTAVLSPERRVEMLAPLRTLIAQLSPYVEAVPPEVLVQRLRDERLILIVAQRGDSILGAATLTIVPTIGLGPVGHVDDVVVDKASRGGGIGRLLMDTVQAEASRLGLRHLDLTSRPSREAANALYRSLGYERRDTNVYRLRLQT